MGGRLFRVRSKLTLQVAGNWELRNWVITSYQLLGYNFSNAEVINERILSCSCRRIHRGGAAQF